MKRLLTLLGIILIGLIVTFFWWQNGLLSPDSSNSKSQIFIIKNGEGVREIANNLKTSGLIRDPIVFFLYARFNGLDKKIQAGDFRLSPSMTMGQVANNLTHGILDIWVTIPEGLRAEEISDVLKTKIPSFSKTWNTTLIQNEGYLFPDTYLIPRDATVDMIALMMKDNFQKKYDSVKTTKTTNLTDSQTIIVASIIEKEAKFAEDRPMVASVIMNRLNMGMALQVDPTVAYALGYQADTKTWWKKDLTFDDLKVDSPFNTYLNTGLPPSPISNPGLSAIEAALNPAKSNYLYYYSDNKGHLHFATTVEGHNANIQKYGGQ